jgi:hypothetical protein
MMRTEYYDETDQIAESVRAGLSKPQQFQSVRRSQ